MESSDLTIAIPVYERVDYFEDALRSALDQTIMCQIIVVDNNSSHETFKLIIDEIGNGRVKYYKNEENLGMIGNWNRCIELCQTEYIAILHDDDLLASTFVEIVISIPQSWDVLFTRSIVGEKVPKRYKQAIIPSKKLSPVSLNCFVFGNFNQVPGTIFKKKCAIAVGLFENTYGFILDFHFWLKLVSNSKAYYLNRKLSFYRISSAQGTNSLYKNMIANTYAIMDLVPLYVANNFLRFWSSFRIYSDGMDVYEKDSSRTKVSIDFRDNDTFIKDHFRFRKIYQIVLLKKTIIFIINKFVKFNLRYTILKSPTQ